MTVFIECQAILFVVYIQNILNLHNS